MRWFKHLTNASEDIKIKRLEEEFGNDGYVGFFKLLEKIGREGNKYRLTLKKYPILSLAKDFHIEEKKFEEILIKMTKLTLLSEKEYKKGILYVPKLRKYADEYTTRGRLYYKKRKLARFSKQDYQKVEQAYMKYKGIKPQGEEWLPIKKAIKTMFLSNRKPREIIACMKWMSENDFYKGKWTIHTVVKKLPEFVSGQFQETVDVPEYAKGKQ